MEYSPYNLKDVYDASAREKFKVSSTFAGGGGSSTGYRLAGGKVLCINEFVEEARKTYAEIIQKHSYCQMILRNLLVKI